MGCSQSIIAADRDIVLQLGAPPMQQKQHIGAEAMATLLMQKLDQKVAKADRLASPQQKTPNVELASRDRGLTLPLLRAIRKFYAQHDALKLTVHDIWQSAEIPSIRSLIASSQVSLVESLVSVAGDNDMPTGALIGSATTIFSYAWTGTHLGDLLDAIERQLEAFEEQPEATTRYVWVDLFCGGHDEPGLFDDPLACADEVLLYASPLTDEWLPPLHPFVLAERGDAPIEGSTRTGPVAITRAWSVLEVASALARGCKLHVVLSPEEHAQLAESIAVRFDAIADIFGAVDARGTQLTNLRDRDFLRVRFERFKGGISRVNLTLATALHEWLVAEARDSLARLPAHDVGTSALLPKVAQLLKHLGKHDEALPLWRECYEARRRDLGADDPQTLGALRSVAQVLLDLEEGREALSHARAAVGGLRAALGAQHRDTIAAAATLGAVLAHLPELEVEACEVLREVANSSRAVLGEADPDSLLAVGQLAEVLYRTREGGEGGTKLKEARQLLSEARATAKRALGERHRVSLDLEAQLACALTEDSATRADGRAALARSVGRMADWLGDDDHQTLKYAQALSQLPAVLL